MEIVYPERLLIFHAGTGRTVFLGCLKVITIFVFAIFGIGGGMVVWIQGEPTVEKILSKLNVSYSKIVSKSFGFNYNMKYVLVFAPQILNTLPIYVLKLHFFSTCSYVNPFQQLLRLRFQCY